MFLDNPVTENGNEIFSQVGKTTSIDENLWKYARNLLWCFKGTNQVKQDREHFVGDKVTLFSMMFHCVELWIRQ